MKKQLFTSYYGNSRKLKKHGVEIIGISLKSPFDCLQVSSIKPEWRFMKTPKEEYKRQYIAKLEAIGVDFITKELIHITNQSESTKFALCCFESLKTPDDWCHRTMFAEWFEMKTGLKINEFDDLV